MHPVSNYVLNSLNHMKNIKFRYFSNDRLGGLRVSDDDATTRDTFRSRISS